MCSQPLLLVCNLCDVLSSNSDNTEDKETEVRESSGKQPQRSVPSVCHGIPVQNRLTQSCWPVCAAGTLCADRTPAQTARSALLIINSDFRELGRGLQHATFDPQLRSMLQWAAASVVDVPQIQLNVDRELQQVIQ